jgi:hypothetical protein
MPDQSKQTAQTLPLPRDKYRLTFEPTRRLTCFLLGCTQRTCDTRQEAIMALALAPVLTRTALLSNSLIDGRAVAIPSI